MYLYASTENGLKNKETIEIGADADILIFNLNTIEDKANYPCFGSTNTPPEGIEYVFVNGVMTVNGKEVFNVKPGKLIRSKCEVWKY